MSNLLRTRKLGAIASFAAALAIGGAFGSVPSAFAAGAVQIGQPAPEFTATDSKGAPVSLSQYRGKVVVLEWTNADCPYTHKHYASGNMQSLQSLAQKNGVVWLSGTAPTQDARDLAGMIARDTKGVTSVNNNIEVAPH